MEKKPDQIRRLKGALALFAIAFSLLVLSGGPGDRAPAENSAIAGRPAWNG